MTDAYPVSSLSLSVLLCGQGTLYSSVFASFYPYAYSSTASFICCLFFNDIRSILDIQSHCVVMGASPLISTLFIHSHVTRYLVFWGEFSQECGRKATCQRRRSNEVEWVINVIPVVYIYSMQ